MRIVLICFSVLSIVTVMRSQWSNDPTHPVVLGEGINSVACSDGNGGAYVAFEEGLDYPRHLRLQRVMRNGYKPWGEGRSIGGSLEEQFYVRIVEDGQGGVILAYHDYSDSGSVESPFFTEHLLVQKVDSNGNLLWGQSGVRITKSNAQAGEHAIASDGMGGCMVAWMDSATTLRAQRIGEPGEPSWGNNGIFVAPSFQDRPQLVGLGGDRTMLVYDVPQDSQRFQYIVDGNLKWFGGLALLSSASVIRAGGEATVYFIGLRWIGQRNGKFLFTVNLQTIDTGGRIGFGQYGVELDTLNTISNIDMDLAVSAQFTAAAWTQFSDSSYDLGIQLNRKDGSAIFPRGGLPVSAIRSKKELHGVVSSGSDAVVCVWHDARGGTFAQKIDTSGTRLWGVNDVEVGLAAYSATVGDGSGGVICVGRGDDGMIIAQQVSRDGQLGHIVNSVESGRIAQRPNSVKLQQNYPNPFNPVTTISYSVGIRMSVRLELYDLLGRQLRTLFDGTAEVGAHTIVVNSEYLASGVYFYRIVTPNGSSVRTMLVQK